MRHDVTNSQLLALETDIQKQMQSSAAFFFFNKEKVRRFYQQNAISLSILNKKMAAAVEKYVVHKDEKPETATDKDGVLIYVFNSDEDEKKYRDETAEFLNRTVKIEL